ncbi:MAG: GH1 family beta-glucosidase [Sedimentisphaeraceae bacterium JB056]
MEFPENFMWGAATSSYQIEGGWEQDGKTMSVWDMLCRRKGAIWSNQSGDVACNHYNKYEEDVKLMAEIGLKAYRFSISWPRVMSETPGKVNEKGLDFYSRLVDRLLEAGIKPYATLFHWDYPLSLYKKGGWLCEQSPEWFADYTKAVTEKLSDRVQNWMTLNEPQVFTLIGHKDGRHAPGDHYSPSQMYQMIHNVLLSHGRSVQTIRQYAKTKPSIGYAPVGLTRIPQTTSPEDIQAAKDDMFGLDAHRLWSDGLWFDPVCFGKYPDGYLERIAFDAPKIKDGDMELISQPLDFLGLNIYNGIYSSAENRPQTGDMFESISHIANNPNAVGTTGFDWPVTPECLYWGTKFFYERYKKPIFITENGLSNPDWPALDGKVHDPQRIDFLHRHLLELGKSISEGNEVKGYFQWSLMDNFEWAAGYSKRFGLIYVDYNTQQRILKDSAHWYRQVIATNGSSLS